MKFVAPALFLAFLIPTGIQGATSLSIYGFRFYFAYAILGMIPVIGVIRSWLRGTLFDDIKVFFREPHTIWFALFVLSGAISVFRSPNLRVGAVFWLWTAMTVLAMPWLVQRFVRVSEKWILFLTGSFLALNAGVVLSDTISLNAFGAGHSIGSYVPFMRDGKVFFKPYAWQFEPSYFAGMMLMGALFFRIVSWVLRGPMRVVAYLLALYLTVAALLSMSRTGIIGTLVFILLEAFGLILSKKFFLFQTPGRAQRFVFSVLGGAIVLSVIGLGIWYFSKSSSLPPYLAAMNFRQPSQDGSFKTRFQDALNGIAVFQQRPWFGSGPGLAKQDFFQVEAGADIQDFKRKPGPIANSAYVELLSEWGIVGFLLYAGAVVAMFFRFENAIRFRVWILLGVLYFALGTIPRLSVWVFLALIWAFVQNRTAGALTTSVSPPGIDSEPKGPSSS